MATKSLNLLIDQARSALEEIRQHPEFIALDYHPDSMIGDAIQACNELDKALNDTRFIHVHLSLNFEN
ncbi:hypothetical protein HUN01_28625 [Nostoc edaphicum CCNP1411]|uniref:Uncharacterized protein n=1 Tax=Nostoc edaphicum CCNP1411 TaxID=1472755 RepID=A0A7D7LGX1_9NOSO|nr:hypothetical protein [Nostoc edaphicum]QMS91370.1 hypothetical protein HUN01_28625 [Nostoc edaphicum CCNP1411]